MDDDGKTIWGRETREVTNAELKALMESYKEKSRDSVLSELSDRRDTAANHTFEPKEKPHAR